MKISVKTVAPGMVLAIMVLVTSNNPLFGQNRPQNGEQKEPPTFEKLLEKMDANEDGKLSKLEVKGPLKEQFDKMDTNKDSYISKEEFENAPKPERKNRPSRNH